MRGLAILLLTLPLTAEYRWIEVEFGGIECASCATFLEGKLGRRRDVESVSMDRAKGLLRVTVKPAAALRPDQVRDQIQQGGFTPGAIRVRVRGVLAREGDAWSLRVEEADRTLRVEAGDPALRRILDGAEGKAAELEGTLLAPERGGPELLRAAVAAPPPVPVK